MNRLIFLPFALTIPSIASAQNDKVRENILNPVIVTGTGTYRKAENSPVEVKDRKSTRLNSSHTS